MNKPIKNLIYILIFCLAIFSSNAKEEYFDTIEKSLKNSNKAIVSSTDIPIYEDDYVRIEGCKVVDNFGFCGFRIFRKKIGIPGEHYALMDFGFEGGEDIEVEFNSSEVNYHNQGDPSLPYSDEISNQALWYTFKIKDFHPLRSEERKLYAYFNVEYVYSTGGSVFLRFPIEVVLGSLDKERYNFKTNSSSFDYNYILTNSYHKPTLNDKEDFIGIQNKKYFDGLGRPIQEVAINQGGEKEDIINIIELDAYGRTIVDALPFAKKRDVNTKGKLETNPGSSLYKFYEESNTGATSVFPYSRQYYETSPIGRLKEQSAPGEAWQKYSSSQQNNTIKKEYQNTSALTWSVNYVDANFLKPQLIQTGYKDLELIIIKDENWISGNDHTTKEYKDFQNRVVLKRTYNNEVAHDTYYVYDNYGNLSFVLPPKIDVKQPITQTILDNLCYQYIYDIKSRLIRKKIPGKGWEEIVYDFANRPILTKQTLVPQKIVNGIVATTWNFTKYDDLGRVYSSGLVYIKKSISRVQLQNYQNEELRDDFFENSASNILEEEDTIINYFGSYPTVLTTSTSPTVVFEQAVTNELNGLATGSKIKVLDTDKWITTVTYYDKKARPIYIHSHNEYLNTTDIVKTQYDYFTGLVLKTRTSHQKENSSAIVTVDVFDYDHSLRLLNQRQFVGGSNLALQEAGKINFNEVIEPTTRELPEIINIPEDYGNDNVVYVNDEESVIETVAKKAIYLNPGFTYGVTDEFEYSMLFSVERSEEEGSNDIAQNGHLIVANTYDSLGQLNRKKVGNVSDNPLQTVDYKYNIRGWLTHINNPEIALDNDLFAFKINYAATQIPGSVGLYNGNISETHWKTANDNNLRNYSYNYDALNRIVGATGSNTDFNLTSVGYDKMGNITNLERRGAINQDSNNFGVMDNLEYTYIGNQLQKVTDAGNKTYGFKDGNTQGDDYGYDDNGNMISDVNKGISLIAYNHLNLPTQVQTDQGVINYTYDATGVKQSKKVVGLVSNSTTKYAGNYVYENDKLQFFNHPEGYVEPKNVENYQEGFTYVYQYKDHLGNIRLSYADDNNDGIIQTDGANSEIREEKNYYPFGLTHKGYNTEKRGRIDNYGYVGKEEQNELGLNTIDFGWRNFDAALGRWMNVDNLAEKYNSYSPYHYAGNNPVLNFDIDGNVFTESSSQKVGEVIGSAFSSIDYHNKRKSEIQSRYDNGKISKEKLDKKLARHDKKIGQYESVVDEINTLIESEQVYDIVEDDSLGSKDKDVAATSFNFGNGNVQINISASTSLGLLAHELRHAYQFEIGESSLGSLNAKEGTGFLHDKHDELAGYQRQGLFGSNEGVTNINNLPKRYESLPTGPVNVHTARPYGKSTESLNYSQRYSLSVRQKQAYRFNGKTYYYQNK